MFRGECRWDRFRAELRQPIILFSFIAVSTPPTILVGRLDKVFWLRVEGRGTFQNSLLVKQSTEAMMAAGLREFVVDLERCPIMDSTFLGTLTGAAARLRELGAGAVHVINANPRNLQLMTSLGLNYILEVDETGTRWAEERKKAAKLLEQFGQPQVVGKLEQAEHVLEAHQALADLSDANEERFQDVIVFLEKELGSEGGH